MILQTDRLILREFTSEDVQAVHNYASDIEVCRYTDWGPNTLDDTRAFIEDVIASQSEQPRNQFTVAIAVKESNSLIGACSIIKKEALQGEMGYVLNRDYWGHGFASEAAKAMLSFGFKELKLHRICATCRPQNKGSFRVMEKLGMRKEGHFREHLFFKEKWHDSFLYSILSSEY
ncbi:GNAT family N-acetyltransferase [Paenibacillus harenae]|uniref:GNAT family N-acetyltransferase n=1 Tax=Paenibacillus harenae TaxID=306543 RepID=UPI002793EED3|nr:GNAT family N-acetyltransferase [Paenibacillus harenae]MDQ0060535.1 RimJ/RimL family protein N-acetyltransferase [Paenibacillus harenae]